MITEIHNHNQLIFEGCNMTVACCLTFSGKENDLLLHPTTEHVFLRAVHRLIRHTIVFTILPFNAPRLLSFCQHGAT